MRHRTEQMNEGLDSFLDIVTNVIGLMILIAAAIALHAQNMQVSLGSPVLTPQPEMSTVFFDCTNSRVLPREIAEHGEIVRAAIGRQFPGQYYYEDAVDWLNRQDLSTEYYDVSFEVWNTGYEEGINAVLYPKSKFHGDSIKELDQNCSFVRRIQEIDPEKAYVQFDVRADSFEVFRKARRIAREHGLKVAWRPLRNEFVSRNAVVGNGTRVAPD